MRLAPQHFTVLTQSYFRAASEPYDCHALRWFPGSAGHVLFCVWPQKMHRPIPISLPPVFQHSSIFISTSIRPGRRPLTRPIIASQAVASVPATDDHPKAEVRGARTKQLDVAEVLALSRAHTQGNHHRHPPQQQQLAPATIEGHSRGSPPGITSAAVAPRKLQRQKSGTKRSEFRHCAQGSGPRRAVVYGQCDGGL